MAKIPIKKRGTSARYTLAVNRMGKGTKTALSSVRPLAAAPTGRRQALLVTLEAAQAKAAGQETKFRSDMTRVRVALAGVVSTEEAERWLYTEQAFFGGQRPRDLVRQRQTNRVLEAIVAVASGIYV